MGVLNHLIKTEDCVGRPSQQLELPVEHKAQIGISDQWRVKVKDWFVHHYGGEERQLKTHLSAEALHVLPRACWCLIERSPGVTHHDRKCTCVGGYQRVIAIWTDSPHKARGKHSLDHN